MDLARITGWAYGPVEWAAPWFGSWHMPLIGGEGMRFACFENELVDALELYQPETVILEAPIALPAMTNRAAMWQQLGMRAIARAACWRQSIVVSEVSPDIVRSEILGYSRIPGHPGAIKDHVMGWCRKHGLRVPDHNAGDAVLIWTWHKRCVTGARAVQQPLWGKVA